MEPSASQPLHRGGGGRAAPGGLTRLTHGVTENMGEAAAQEAGWLSRFDSDDQSDIHRSSSSSRSTDWLTYEPTLRFRAPIA